MKGCSNKHIGKTISILRQLRGIKQQTLAYELGISQQAISKLEQSHEVDRTMLLRISNILDVPPQTLETFDEDLFLNYIRTLNSNHTFNGQLDYHLYCMQLNKITELYERLLEYEREKTALKDN